VLARVSEAKQKSCYFPNRRLKTLAEGFAPPQVPTAADIYDDRFLPRIESRRLPWVGRWLYSPIISELRCLAFDIAAKSVKDFASC
jgi:hypothetical protein